MKHGRIIFFSIATLLTSASVTCAQQVDEAPGGAQGFLEDLMEDMQPMWRELQDFLDAMGPALKELMDEVRDWSAYEPPEVLENGDIIIRRKPDAPRPEAEELPPPVEL